MSKSIKFLNKRQDLLIAGSQFGELTDYKQITEQQVYQQCNNLEIYLD